MWQNGVGPALGEGVGAVAAAASTGPTPQTRVSTPRRYESSARVAATTSVTCDRNRAELLALAVSYIPAVGDDLAAGSRRSGSSRVCTFT